MKKEICAMTHCKEIGTVLLTMKGKAFLYYCEEHGETMKKLVKRNSWSTIIYDKKGIQISQRKKYKKNSYWCDVCGNFQGRYISGNKRVCTYCITEL